MKRQGIVTLLAVATALSSTQVFAQNRRPVAAPKGPVAVVDVSYLFKNHRTFKAKMDQMKKEVQAFENSLRSVGEGLAKDKERLKEYKPGSPNYSQLEQQLADKATRMQVQTQQKKREFLEREARVYFETYQHVRTVIQNYADQKGISLVLRFTSDPIQPDDRGSVLAGVNRGVVYQRGVDITPEILSLLDRAPSKVSRRNTAPPKGVRQGQRPSTNSPRRTR